MVQRRIRAILELVVSTLILSDTIYIWKILWNKTNGNKPIPVSTPELATGALNAGAWAWIYDKDLGSIRANWFRRLLTTIAWQGWQTTIRRLSSDSRTANCNFAVGSLIGVVGYRLWYGLLHPLPDIEE